MQISAINKYQQPQFKSAIPVYHWVREAGDKFNYKLVAHDELTRTLQEKVVEFFNRPNNPNHSINIKKAINYLKDKDIYYSLRLKHNDNTGKKNKPARSFYNSKGGWNYNLTKFKPISYLITGIDVDYFENEFAKPLGKAKSEYRHLGDAASLANLKMAWHNFYANGAKFVEDKKHQIRDLYDVSYGIHTKFVVQRNADGKDEYIFEDMKLLPEEGSESPLEKLSMRKRK